MTPGPLGNCPNSLAHAQSMLTVQHTIGLRHSP